MQTCVCNAQCRHGDPTYHTVFGRAHLLLLGKGKLKNLADERAHLGA
jgi:hypothetical protein